MSKIRHGYNNFVYAFVRQFPNLFLSHWLEKFLRDDKGNTIHWRCEDCGKPYGDATWIDVIIPDEQWVAIGMPEDGSGILCGACIIARGEKLLGVTHAHLEFKED